MKIYESPMCFDCPVWSEIGRNPETVYSDPVQKVTGYLEDFLKYRDAYIDGRVAIDAELRAALEDKYVAAENPCAADDEFVKTAAATKWDILAYLVLQRDYIEPDLALVLGRCARQLAAGTCANSGVMPGYADKLAEMRAKGLVE
jgi:hypothetical protein